MLHFSSANHRKLLAVLSNLPKAPSAHRYNQKIKYIDLRCHMAVYSSPIYERRFLRLNFVLFFSLIRMAPSPWYAKSWVCKYVQLSLICDFPGLLKNEFSSIRSINTSQNALGCQEIYLEIRFLITLRISLLLHSELVKVMSKFFVCSEFNFHSTISC